MTPKGKRALENIAKYFLNENFTSKTLTDAAEEHFTTRTLNALANQGYLQKFDNGEFKFLTAEKKGDLGAVLRAAKENRKDEFFTLYQDIKDEVEAYDFSNKYVYLPCDSKKSNFWKYFTENFNSLGLRKVAATSYNEDGTGIKMICTKEGITESSLVGNGDFRSLECVEILQECDAVVTNPPFSLFRDFIALLIKFKKEFLVIGNNNALAYKEIFPLVKSNQLWCGLTYNKTMIFRVGEGYVYNEKLTESFNDGYKYGKVAAITWFTNMKTKRKTEKLELTHVYAPEVYQKYDNYNAIEVSKISEIPKDYAGIMGVPITFLNIYNPEQFEIVGAAMGWTNSTITENEKQLLGYNPNIISSHGTRGYGIINGKQMYHRILIKNKELQ